MCSLLTGLPARPPAQLVGDRYVWLSVVCASGTHTCLTHGRTPFLCGSTARLDAASGVLCCAALRCVWDNTGGRAVVGGGWLGRILAASLQTVG